MFSSYVSAVVKDTKDGDCRRRVPNHVKDVVIVYGHAMDVPRLPRFSTAKGVSCWHFIKRLYGIVDVAGLPECRGWISQLVRDVATEKPNILLCIVGDFDGVNHRANSRSNAARASATGRTRPALADAYPLAISASILSSVIVAMLGMEGGGNRKSNGNPLWSSICL